MKKNGFTLVELITTFALTAIIIVILLNVVSVIKDLYTSTNIKTELYINQSNLSKALNSKIKKDNLKSISPCTETSGYLICHVFEFYDEEKSIKLKVKEKSISFGNYVYKLDEKTKVELAGTLTQLLSDGDMLLSLRIPIKNELYPDLDFGINLIQIYSPN